MSASSSPRSPRTPSLTATRHHELDWLRIIAFGVLVIYHTGMYYVNWDFHVKSPHAGTGLEPFMLLTAPWRMDLLFLISGAATAFMWRRDSPPAAARLRERTGRLLLPLLFGMLVIVPPQSYLEVVQHGYGGSFVDFLRLYYSAYHGFCDGKGHCLLLPTWNHLWYLPYLAFYTALLWLLLRWRPQLLVRLASATAPLLRGGLLLAVPVLWLLLTRLALRDHFPSTHALLDDWFMHAQYFSVFLFGALLAHTPHMLPRLQAWRWLALVLALSGWATLISTPASLRDAGGVLALLRPAAVSLMQWTALVASLGFAHRHLRFDNAWRRYLSEAVFPVYLLHQTLIIVLARAVAPWALPPGLEAALLVVATLALSLLSYEAVRRVGWLRPLFGLKRQVPPGDAAMAGA